MFKMFNDKGFQDVHNSLSDEKVSIYTRNCFVFSAQIWAYNESVLNIKIVLVASVKLFIHQIVL